MFERMTTDARHVVTNSPALAVEDGADKARVQHLLVAVAGADGPGAHILAEYGVTAAGLREAAASHTHAAGLTDAELAALETVGIDAQAVFHRIEETFGSDALTAMAPSRRPRRRGRLGGPFDPSAKKVIELSLREATELDHQEISSVHILLALLRHGVPEPMSSVLAEHGVTYTEVRQHTTTTARGAV